MLVISDNSPLNILIRIGQVHVLPALFERIVIPRQIVEEMAHADAPAIVRQFIQAPPEWLGIAEPHRVLQLPGLDLGERAAISLALESCADLLLVDEQAARRIAVAQGLKSSVRSVSSSVQRTWGSSTIWRQLMTRFVRRISTSAR